MTEHRRTNLGFTFDVLVVAAIVAALVMAIGSAADGGQIDTPMNPDASGQVNPWAAGDAAALQYFADLGRERFLTQTP